MTPLPKFATLKYTGDFIDMFNYTEYDILEAYRKLLIEL